MGMDTFAARREEKQRRERERRRELVERCSAIVNEMPPEVREMLGSRMGDTEITAQSSFLSHFRDAVPKYDEETFRIKFIELFSTVGERVAHRTAQQKKRGDGRANEKFWREFEVLFEEVPDAYGKRKGLKYRLRLVTKTLVKALKFLRKITFWF